MTTMAGLRCYDPATDSWTQLADGPVVSHAGSAVLGGLLYVLGGRGADGMYSPDLHCYDPGTDTWTAKATALGRVSDPAVVAAAGKLFVLGGEQQIDTVFQPMIAVWIYDPATDTWASSQDLTVPHTAAGACEVGGYLYGAGGVADGYHDHEAAIDGDDGTDDLYSDDLTVWMTPPSPLSIFNGTGGGWAPLAV